MNGRWFRVALLGGGAGFLPRRTLRRANIVHAPDAASTQRSAAQGAERALTKAAPLNSQPSLMSAVIVRIPAGGRVQIVRRSIDRQYVEVRYRGRRGYVMFNVLAKTLGGGDGE